MNLLHWSTKFRFLNITEILTPLSYEINHANFESASYIRLARQVFLDFFIFIYFYLKPNTFVQSQYLHYYDMRKIFVTS